MYSAEAKCNHVIQSSINAARVLPAASRTHSEVHCIMPSISARCPLVFPVSVMNPAVDGLWKLCQVPKLCTLTKGERGGGGGGGGGGDLRLG